MARTTLQVLIIVLLLPATAGISFQVNVDEVRDHKLSNLRYQEDVEKLQKINATVENIGSIGCTYRMKANFKQRNKTFERFSSPQPLWQGDYSLMELIYIPSNYSGEVHTNISLEYCGQKKQLDAFSFNVTEKTSINSTLESRTISSSSEEARVEVEGDLLVPQKEPPYWKTSSTSIENGTAKIEYDAPIFDERETIKYTVLENGEIRGSTNVELQPEPTLKEKILDRKTELIALLLGLSAFFNLALLLEREGFITRIKDFEYDLPEFRKKD